MLVSLICQRNNSTPDDVQWNAQGRNKAIVLGQVGIRCRYCARLPTWSRSRGAVYYSATLVSAVRLYSKGSLTIEKNLSLILHISLQF
jgi:hypothetical protein